MKVKVVFKKAKFIWEKMNWLVRAMVLILLALYIMAAFAPMIAPYDYTRMHRRYPNAPPSTIYLGSFKFSFSNPYFFSKDNGWKIEKPYVYQVKLVDPLERTYEEIKDKKYYLEFFKNGRLFTVASPARIFVLGTDRNGWDLFSRLVMAARVSLTIGFIGVLISFSIGILVGCASGYFGGWTDIIIMRLCEVMMSIPGFPLLLLLSMIIPPQFSSTMRLFMIVTVLSFIGWPGLAITIRGMAASIRSREYVMAAKALGANNWRIITRYIVPGVLNYAIVSATLSIPGFMLGEAGLSLLGLGIKPPDASWGNMLSAALGNISRLDTMWWILVPGWLIFISVMAFNFLGDFLRDCYDPRMRSVSAVARVFWWGHFVTPRVEEIDSLDEIVKSGEVSLKVRNLATYFATNAGIVKAVEDVGFSVRKGKTLGIVGESACGKSVTALSILGLIQTPGEILEGTVLFNGKDLAKLNKYEIRKIRGKDIAMIFQEPMASLDPMYKVGDQITETLLEHKKNLRKNQAQQKALELLGLVGIPTPEQAIEAYPHQLSGGMRQRVMIASALSCQPQILIADEPTTALDVTIQAQILKLLNELRQKIGMSVIMITHNLGIIAEIADDVAVMYAGKIVEYAPVDEIFEKPKHPYTEGLYESVPRLGSSTQRTKQRLVSIPGNVPDPLNLPSGCSFWPRCRWAKPVCKEKFPLLKKVGKNHLVRCWKSGGKNEPSRN